MPARIAFFGFLLCLVSSLAFGANDGLIAQWKFDEGQGEVCADSSGAKRDARLSGAEWVKQGDGFAVSLDGFDDHVNCGSSKSIGIGGSLTIEAWVKPMRQAHGESLLLGEGFSTYALTYYNGERVYFYIGNSGNGLSAALNYQQWNHVVATFDGKNMRFWVNGKPSGERESKQTTYEPAGDFTIGSAGEPGGERFKGMLDNVRVYNRPISSDEAPAHFQAEKAAYLDLTRLGRVKVTPYFYPERGEVVVEADYKHLLPLEGKARLEITLASKAALNNVLQRRSVEEASTAGTTDVSLPCDELPAGEYRAQVMLLDGHGAYPAEEFTFSHPRLVRPLVPPREETAPPLAPPPPRAPFTVSLQAGGGFTIKIKNGSYPFQSRISWPNGTFNQFTANDKPHDNGETSWKVRVHNAGKDKYEVDASGDFYSIHREISVFPTHVYVKDNYTNATNEDLGLLVYNETPVTAAQVTGSWLSGYDRRGRQAQLSFPHYSISTFFTDTNSGIGIVPMDDVFVIQAVPYVQWQNATGVGTEKLCLGPGKSYCLEWAIYPTASGDYYDFVNTFRKVENRISTVEGPPGYITYSPRSSRMVADDDFIQKRNLKIGIMSVPIPPADDPDLQIEGFEFVDFPKTIQELQLQATAIRKKHPNLKLTFHIAHSLYCTNQPERFSDSKVIGPNGKQAAWGDGAQFGPEKQAKGWNWWIFYPTPGNSFHDAMMKSVDVMMDQMGFDGAALDGFFAGYGGEWTYDRRDEHSAEIDPQSKTIKRKIGSVLLLSQPSMIEYCRKIRDKGGVVIGMHTVFTRSIANEKYILFTDEQTSGPGLHFAPNMMPLSDTRHRNEKDMYLDMLDKLNWGLMFVHVTDSMFFRGLRYPSLAAKEFPITFEEIRAGMVKGKERIVTMKSGVYGWPGDQRLHAVFRFDGRGVPVPNDFITTVDSAQVRTKLDLNTLESAVIEPIAARLKSEAPINTRVLSCEGDSLKIQLNGEGEATLEWFVGSTSNNTACRVTIGESTTMRAAQANGLLSIPLKLSGPLEVGIER